jgi:hypothetical protein
MWHAGTAVGRRLGMSKGNSGSQHQGNKQFVHGVSPLKNQTTKFDGGAEFACAMLAARTSWSRMMPCGCKQEFSGQPEM